MREAQELSACFRRTCAEAVASMMHSRDVESVTDPHALADQMFGACSLPGCPTDSQPVLGCVEPVPPEVYIEIPAEEAERIIAEIEAEMARHGLGPGPAWGGPTLPACPD